MLSWLDCSSTVAQLQHDTSTTCLCFRRWIQGCAFLGKIQIRISESKNGFCVFWGNRNTDHKSIKSTLSKRFNTKMQISVSGLNVQSFRQMYWNLRDFMSILRWTDHELWLIADPPISLIVSFIDWFKLLLVNFLRFSFSVAISLWTRTNSSFYFFDTQILTR